MQETDALVKLLKRALQIALEESPPDWEQKLEKLDARIRRLDSRRRAEAAQASNERDSQREIEWLNRLLEPGTGGADTPRTFPMPPRHTPRPTPAQPQTRLERIGGSNLYRWNETWAVGHKEIDRAHKKFFDDVNRLLTLHRTNPENPMIHLEAAEMFEHSRTHFHSEERFMDTIGYPFLADHAQEHQRVVAEIQRVEALPSLFFVSKLRFLAEWLINHILEHDRRLGIWWAENRVSAPGSHR